MGRQSKRPETSLLDSKIAKSKKKLNRNNNQKFSLLIIVVLVLLLIGLLVVIILKMPDQPKNMSDQAVQVTETADYQILISFPNNEGFSYYPFENQFVYLSQNRVQLLKQNNEVLFSENLDYSRPVSVQNADYFLAADRESGQITVLNHQGKHFSVNLDGMFAGAYFASRDYIAVIEENLNQPAFVHIISLLDGQTLITLQFFESGYPLSIAFDNQLEYFDVLLSNTSSAKLQSLINRYDFTGKQLGQIKLTEHPNLYTQIFYDHNKNICLAGPGGLLALNFDNNEILDEFSSNRIHGISTGNKIFALASDRVDDGTFLVEWQPGESKFIKEDLDLISQFDQVDYKENILALSHNNRIQLIDMKNKSLILDQYIDSSVFRIGIVDNKIILVTENGLKSLSY